MSLFVIDASVATKWVLHGADEELLEQALDLLDQYGRDEIQFVVPDLFWAEFGQVMWKAVRSGRCTRTTAEASMAVMKERRLPTVASETLIELALNLAMAFDRTVYDSLYVALAVDSRSHLITADEKLANALAARLPVKWLGAL